MCSKQVGGTFYFFKLSLLTHFSPVSHFYTPGVSHKQTPVQTTFWQTVGACHNNYKCESLSFQIFIIFLVQTALFSYLQFQYFIQVFVYGFVISIGYKILADC